MFRQNIDITHMDGLFGWKVLLSKEQIHLTQKRCPDFSDTKNNKKTYTFR